MYLLVDLLACPCEGNYRSLSHIQRLHDEITTAAFEQVGVSPLHRKRLHGEFLTDTTFQFLQDNVYPPEYFS